jgi:hypothetical protein
VCIISGIRQIGNLRWTEKQVHNKELAQLTRQKAFVRRPLPRAPNGEEADSGSVIIGEQQSVQLQSTDCCVLINVISFSLNWLLLHAMVY